MCPITTPTSEREHYVAISKRLRFEILRRDGFKCRYCHATEVLLTIDHVTPRSLGGSDHPSNLVACCDDCNTGKSSTASRVSQPDLDEEADPGELTSFHHFTNAARWPRILREDTTPAEDVEMALTYLASVKNWYGWDACTDPLGYLTWAIYKRDLYALEAFYLMTRRDSEAAKNGARG